MSIEMHIISLGDASRRLRSGIAAAIVSFLALSLYALEMA